MVKVTELVGETESSSGLNNIGVKDIKEIMGIFKDLKGMQQPQQAAPAPRGYTNPPPVQQISPQAQPVNKERGIMDIKEKAAEVLQLIRIIRGKPYNVRELKKWLAAAKEQQVLGGFIPDTWANQLSVLMRVMREDMDDTELIAFLRGTETEPEPAETIRKANL